MKTMCELCNKQPKLEGKSLCSDCGSLIVLLDNIKKDGLAAIGAALDANFHRKEWVKKEVPASYKG